ncbi:MAG: 16S rRNA (cytosine(967)-C(5))-methyltransferase RsmB [Clostridiales bacterium]|nr:16S rRNA (cytosine(967)-C(5))-methyltransferase RsmB [Clostridiales bacterium]
MNARKAAYLSLMRCEKAGKYANLEIDAAIQKYELEETEKSLFTQLVYGVIERQITLDAVIRLFAANPNRKIPNEARMILRLGLYQILYLDKIPDHAAVNESVKLAKTFYQGAASFINAVLRRALREKQTITFPDKATEYGLSAALYQMWTHQYGAENAEKIAAGMLRKPTLTLRTNTLKTTPEILMQEIECPCKQTKTAPFGIKLLENMPVSYFAPLEDGLCFVQDESSQIAVWAAEAKPGMTVIDACACPGGKSFGLAMDMHNHGKILSMDLHANKLSLIEQGAKTLGIQIIETIAHDSTQYKPEWEAIADIVLCDVPCSGLGILAKKPDIRHKDLSTMAHLPALQYHILQTCSRYVKPQGVLLYTTCTLNQNENERVANRFLTEHTNFAPVSFYQGKSAITLFPFETETDGFFIAKFQKKDVSCDDKG